MNQDQTIKILSICKAAYPVWGRDLKSEDAKTMIMLWTEMLEEYDFELVQASIKTLLASNKWMPSISEVIEKIELIKNDGQKGLTELEAWSMVKKAIRNGTYGCVEEFNNLPPIVQKVVRRPEVIRDWSQLEVSEIDTVISSNFMRSYRAASKDAKEYDQIPQSVKTLISSIGNKMIE